MIHNLRITFSIDKMYRVVLSFDINESYAQRIFPTKIVYKWFYSFGTLIYSELIKPKFLFLRLYTLIIVFVAYHYGCNDINMIIVTISTLQYNCGILRCKQRKYRCNPRANIAFYYFNAINVARLFGISIKFFALGFFFLFFFLSRQQYE